MFFPQIPIGLPRKRLYFSHDYMAMPASSMGRFDLEKGDKSKEFLSQAEKIA